jgi:hypothetical protein
MCGVGHGITHDLTWGGVTHRHSLMVSLTADDGTPITFCDQCAKSGVGSILLMWINTGNWPENVTVPDFISTPPENLINPVTWGDTPPDPSEYM